MIQVIIGVVVILVLPSTVVVLAAVILGKWADRAARRVDE